MKAMTCPYCQVGEHSKVLNTKWRPRKQVIWRRRRCQKCGKNFTTHERTSPPFLLGPEGRH